MLQIELIAKFDCILPRRVRFVAFASFAHGGLVIQQFGQFGPTRSEVRRNEVPDDRLFQNWVAGWDAGQFLLSILIPHPFLRGRSSSSHSDFAAA